MAKIYIVADMEGATGIVKRRSCDPNRQAEWKAGKVLLTDDVLAAIEGIRASGDHEIILRDVHYIGYNILKERLPKDIPIAYVGGLHMRPEPIIGTIDNDIDLLLLLAFHVRSGVEGFARHTMSGSFKEIWINGVLVGEAEIFAALFGKFGIPVGFISGDPVELDLVRPLMPWIKMVEIPKGESDYPPERREAIINSCREALRNGTRDAVERRAEMKVFALAGKLECRAVFESAEMARKWNKFDDRLDGDAICFSGDISEVFRRIIEIAFSTPFAHRHPLFATMAANLVNTIKYRFRW